MTALDPKTSVESPGLTGASGNLVIVRAGDNSLHRGWGADDPGCKFDLIVSYYGSDPSAFRHPRENRVDYVGGKWDGLHALLTERPELLDRYQYLWFPDDDLEADRATIETMFANMRRLDLDIAQPALTPDSYYSHLPFLRSKSFEYRLVDKVEIMAPCFRSDVAGKILPHFRDTMSGFGLDHLWTRLAEQNLGKSAVFDALTVRHTRPLGIHLAATMLKSGRTSELEYRKLATRYGLSEFFPLSYGAVDRSGRRWRSRPMIGLRMAADYFAERKDFRQARRLKKRLWQFLRRQCTEPLDLSQIVLDA